jgi:hypothetical protein
MNKRLSRIEKEHERQEIIASMVMRSISAESTHKTDVHRAYALIKEYEADLADKKIPPVVKKQIAEDMEEVKLLLDKIVNSNDEFQKRINLLILEELEKEDKSPLEDAMIIADPGPKVEGIEWYDELSVFTEKKKAKKSHVPLTSEELEQAKQRFGDETSCSFAKDDKGYFAYTHRCRSKSYPTIDKLPLDKVRFVRSTS